MSEQAPSTASAVPIFANPFSGSGPTKRKVVALEAALRARGLDAEVVWDIEKRRALLADPNVGERCRCVVSAGGDGSLADMINDLAVGRAAGRVPVATLPVGNENLFAKHFGMDGSPESLAALIADGVPRPIDLGRAGDRYFTLMLSAGIDADIVQRVDRWRRTAGKLRRVRRSSYVPRIAGAVFGYRYPRVTLTADDRRVAGCLALVFNLPAYGMGLGKAGIAGDAIGDDGLLDWVVFEKPGALRLGAYALSVYLKARHLRRDDVHHGRATRVTIEAEGDAPVPLQADGDPAGQTPVTIEVCPGALRVMAG